MIVAKFIMGLTIVVGVHFVIALLIERFFIRPDAGQTRIFLACFIALPITSAIWLLFYSTLAPLGWKTAISVSIFGGMVTMIPAALRRWMVRRRAAKTTSTSADIFQ